MIAKAAGAERLKPGTAGWEAQHEITKINRESQAVNQKLADPTLSPEARASLTVRLTELEHATAFHTERLNTLAETNGVGWVAQPTVGKEWAKLNGWPEEAPEGHYWVAGKYKPYLRRHDDSVERMQYNEAARRFERAPSNVLDSLDEVTRTRVIDYAQVVNSNEPWKWRELDSGITRSERRAIKQYAEESGLIPRIHIDPETSYADFSSVRIRVEQLPQHLWNESDRVQFNYLDNLIGGRPEGTTWHHHQDSGRMELVPFGIHNITNHKGGRTTWASGDR